MVGSVTTCLTLGISLRSKLKNNAVTITYCQQKDNANFCSMLECQWAHIGPRDCEDHKST